jgi:hypothetical protein
MLWRLQAAILAGLLAGAITLTGCGGSDGGSDGSALAPLDKISEYLGDGHNGAKPLLDGLEPAPTGLDTQALPTALVIEAPPLTGRTPAKNINWYRVPPVSATRELLVTLQPTADEDSDLYLLSADGETYSPKAACLGYSNRLPAGGDDVNGYAPDWAAFTTPNSQGRQSAQVAVYGMATGATPKHYRVECDPVWGLTVNGVTKGGSLTLYDSHWYRFAGQAGTDYDVMLQAISGDPDTYVYQGDATHFIAKDTQVGSGTSVGFTAAVDGYYYVRVHGFNAGSYEVGIASPGS